LNLGESQKKRRRRTESSLGYLRCTTRGQLKKFSIKGRWKKGKRRRDESSVMDFIGPRKKKG